jgi:hypothetical protein
VRDGVAERARGELGEQNTGKGDAEAVSSAWCSSSGASVVSVLGCDRLACGKEDSVVPLMGVATLGLSLCLWTPRPEPVPCLSSILRSPLSRVQVLEGGQGKPQVVPAKQMQSSSIFPKCNSSYRTSGQGGKAGQSPGTALLGHYGSS